MDVRHPLNRIIASMLMGVMVLNPVVVRAAELALDRAQAGQASLGHAGNGVPLVNINKPNANGLSHNKFSDYNVGQQGLILNNSSKALVQTQLGGYIPGNANLKGGEARLILNEVTGSNASQLSGYTEVAGKSAPVVVANPHGISCDGCGFINTPKVTLTTGTPVVEEGMVTRYDVNGGSIAIEGAGLNAGNVGQFELITRAAQINAEIHAQQLDIIAGRNEVDAQTLKATAKTDDGSGKPSVAIDSSALGGMYAGAIRLVGTEAGVGVKLAGDLAASAGDIQIDANGQLTLGRSAAAGDLSLSAQQVTMQAEVAAGKSADITADSVHVQHSLSAGKGLHVQTQSLVNDGVIQAGVDTDGSANGQGDLQLDGGSLRNNGQLISHGSLQTDLQQLDNSGTIIASADAQISAQQLSNVDGTLLSQQRMHVEAGNLDNRGGTLASNQKLSVEVVGTLNNRDDGLILSRGEGLTVQAQTLENQQGVIQANDGALDVTSRHLVNDQGLIAATAGAVTLASDTFSNQQGQVAAQANNLSITAALVDNSDGHIHGRNLDVSASTQLLNHSGALLATEGILTLQARELLNRGGRVQAAGLLDLGGTDVNNQAGVLGGTQVRLNLAGTLNNANGLVESADALQLGAVAVSNDGGRLRALGTTGESRFTIGGLFDNDAGLVEIGNDLFQLTSDQLSNRNGSVHHLGSRFELDLDDVGSAGGSFISNGELNLVASSWINNSVIQARKITLAIGNFIQSVSGRLLSGEGIVATGHNWRNDGAIETDADLDLTLTGQYSGEGSLLAQGELLLSAASADLAAAAQVRAGDDLTLNVSQQLASAGTITSSGNMVVQAASLTNQGTLGAAGELSVGAATLGNQGGLIFSGDNMRLLTNAFTNLYGDVYSLGDLTLARDLSGNQASLLENRSGSIESRGDMNLRAAVLTNRKELFSASRQQTSGYIGVVCYDCSGDHHNVDYVATERFTLNVEEDSASARIHSGGNLVIQGGAIANHYSSISAGGNVDIDGVSLENIGAAGGDIERVRRFNTGRVTDGTDERFRYYYIQPYNAQGLPKVVPQELYSFSLISDIETTTSTGSLAPAVIQAGGTVNIRASQTLSNASLLENQAPQFGAAPGVDTQVGSGTQPWSVQLNAQLPADLSQQVVDPLTLPGFSLPQGQNGLFNLNPNPAHPYLIETNPAFANLHTFLGSDYLLGLLGYDDELAQKRLGDGLYEQRLIQEAIVARTGKRFLDGLSSDEAQYRYLMDNAVASKQALNLSLGVALTTEQVAALTHDIVWLEEREVNGVKVLAPVLYLAQANDRLAPSGALIQGRDIALISGSELSNSGTLRAGSNLDIGATSINNSGLMQADERLQLLATENIRNTQGGVISGRDVTLLAISGDITNERTISQESRSGQGFSQLTSVVDSAARIEAGNDLVMAAGRDIRNVGGALVAGGDAALEAGGNLLITSAQSESGQMRKDKRHFWSSSTVEQHAGEVQVGGDLQATAGQHLAVIASTVQAGGDISLAARGDVTIASAADTVSSEYHYRRSGKKIDKENVQVRQQASVIEAGGDLAVTAGGDLTLLSSQLKAGDEAYLYAGRELSLLASQNSDYSLYDMKKKGSWGSKKAQRDEVTQVRHVGTTITTGGDLTLVSEGDQLYQRARLESGSDLTLDSGGAITFGAVKDIDQESHEKSKNSWAWTSMKGKGQTDETLLQSQLIAKGETVIRAVEGIQIDVKDINQQTISQTIDAMVGADPELAWLKQMEARGDIDWVRVKEIHDSWDYQHSGLSGVAVLIIAIIVTVLTMGAGSALAGAVSSATGSSALGAGAAAFANAHAVQTVVSTINNKGNPLAGLKDAHSSDNLKGYATSALTAGLTAGVLDSAYGVTGDNVHKVTKGFDLSKPADIAKFGSYLGAQGGIQAVAQTAIQGGSLSENLQNALTNQVQHLLQAVAFNAVGDVAQGRWDEGSPQKIALHAVVGGMLSEAAGGDFRTGALAAGANELLVEQLAGVIKGDQNLELAVSQLIGVAAATATGGDPAKAAELAKNATAYNRQLHPSEKALAKLLAEQSDGKFTVEEIEEQLRLSFIKGTDVTPTTDAIVEGRDGIYDPDGNWIELGNSGFYLQDWGSGNGNREVISYIKSRTDAYSWVPELEFGYSRLIKSDLPATGASDKRDRLSGYVLDDYGGYRVPSVVDGSSYSPRFYSCGSVECLQSGANIDFSDPATLAWLRAADANAVAKVSFVLTAASIPATGGLSTALGSSGTAAGLLAGYMKEDFEGALTSAALSAGFQRFAVTAGVPPKTAGDITAVLTLNKVFDNMAEDFRR